MQRSQKTRVIRLATAAEFLSRTERFRASDPFRTNIMGSVAYSVAKGTRTYDQYFWWILVDSADEVVGIAMRTAPHGMILSTMPVASIEALAEEVSAADVELPGVAGPTDTVRAFLDAYLARIGSESGLQATEASHELLYSLGELTIPAVAGSMEKASPDDYEQIFSWLTEFGKEAGLLMPNPAESIADGLARESWRFWIVDNQIVSMAGHAPLVDIPGGIVGRIGPVFTPQTHRRNGYAGALTAHLSKELLEQGASVMLYTDATNPTSNSVYKRIGFELIDEQKRYEFQGPE